MNRRHKKLAIYAIALCGLILVLCTFTVEFIKNDTIWYNTRTFTRHMSNLKRDKTDLKTIASFEWDKAYTFISGTTKREMEDVIKFHSDAIPNRKIGNQDTNVLFIHNNKVVCFICGTNEELGYFIDFGAFKDYYLCIQATQKYEFVIDYGKEEPYLFHLYE